MRNYSIHWVVGKKILLNFFRYSLKLMLRYLFFLLYHSLWHLQAFDSTLGARLDGGDRALLGSGSGFLILSPKWCQGLEIFWAPSMPSQIFGPSARTKYGHGRIKYGHRRPCPYLVQVCLLQFFRGVQKHWKTHKTGPTKLNRFDWFYGLMDWWWFQKNDNWIFQVGPRFHN